jgi:hypothetical protein
MNESNVSIVHYKTADENKLMSNQIQFSFTPFVNPIDQQRTVISKKEAV